MASVGNDYVRIIREAKQALKANQRLAARRLAEQAAALAPEKEAAWLILGALASPKASIAYLKRALEINPRSSTARKGMHWAIQRLRTSPAAAQPASPPPPRFSTIPESSIAKRRPVVLAWGIICTVILFGALLWVGTPTLSSAANNIPNLLMIAQVAVGKATLTPTPTATFTPSPTNTATPVPTQTLTPSITPSPTNTEVPTNTPIPTATPVPQDEGTSSISLPPGVEKGEVWIDVDLTNQVLQLYKGKNLLNSFIVSTGTWRTPTVLGQYRIYVKYPAADMAGPGYYLPSVPYVMYFYEGYGIHGTYWHSNFGTPMSHGCVNLSPGDAEWVYNRASIGTIVNIHH